MDDNAPRFPTYQPDPRLIQARNTIARHLGVDPSEVTVSVGHENARVGHGSLVLGSPKDAEDLVVTIHRQGLALEEPRITEEVRNRLAELKPISDHAQMVPAETLSVNLRDDLVRVTEGTNFNQKLLEWPGFDPKVASNSFEVSDYAVQNVRDSAYGITMNLHFAHAKGEDKSAAVERFSELTKGRLEDIKQMLTDRVVKYTRMNLTERGLNEQEKQQAEAAAQAEGKAPEEAVAQALQTKIQMVEAKVRDDMSKLIISVNIDHNDLIVTLRSPEQTEEYAKADPNTRDNDWQSAPAGADELRNTNPLTSRIVSLTTQPTPATESSPEKQPQLHKALARSFLFDKDKNIAPDALQIFGSSDIKSALIKEIFTRVVPKHPEKEAQLVEILKSDLFKNHGAWHSIPGDAGVAKPEPLFSKVAGKNDLLEIAFTLRQDKDPSKNQLLQVVEGLAALDTPPLPEGATNAVLAEKIETGPITPAQSILANPPADSAVERFKQKQANQPNLALGA